MSSRFVVMDTAQVISLGHPIVDVLSPSEDELVASLGLQKGTMTLVDDEQAEKIYASLGPATEASGGSAANTAAGLASLGANVEFIGKVRDDGLGLVFTHDIRAAGVQFEVQPARSGPARSGVMAMITRRSRCMAERKSVPSHAGICTCMPARSD